MEEIWKDVPNYVGVYQVSSLGRIRSLDRITRNGHSILGRMMKPAAKVSKYLIISLARDGYKRSHSLHKIIAQTFIGERPKGFDIDHIDNDRSNNRVDNLEYVTRRENVRRGQGSSLKVGGTSKYTGVCWHKSNKRWRATIGVNGKGIYLGDYEFEIDAASAYNGALRCVNVLQN